MGETGAAGSSDGGELLSLLDRFDRAWRGGSPPRIDEFLPPVSDVAQVGDEALRHHQLAELIKVDLEHRWRRAREDRTPPSVPASSEGGPEPDSLPLRPLLEDYVARYRELGPLDRLSPALVGEEYRVRHRWGDGPGHAEYATRFSELSPALDATLAAVDAELATSVACSGSAAPADRSASTLHEAPRFSCPHCCALIDAGPGAWPEIPDCPACGGSIAIEVPGLGARPPFARLGRYELGELLGAGGFGSVWRARDVELRREVAVKVPRGGFLGSRTQEERFLREARSAAQLRHRGLVAVHDSGRDHGTVFIVSELVHGPSLAQWLEQGRLGVREAAELAAQVADALDCAHRHGVVHRDLKPSNILLDSDHSDGGGQTGADRSPAPAADPTSWNLPAFHPRIVDFGLAKHDASEATMTFDGQVLGTLAYMSPEQLRSPHSVDGRSDVYSLGVVLYQLLTHELPFRGASPMLQVQVLEDEPSPPRQLNDRIPRDLETITLKCLAKEPARRYASAGELAEDLRRFLAREPIRARPVSRFERLRRWCQRNSIAASLAGILVLTYLAGFVGVMWQWLRAEGYVLRARSEREREEGNLAEARKFAKDMYTQVGEQLDQKRKRTESQRRLFRSALRMYEGLSALPQSRDPDVRLAAGQASARVAFVREKLSDDGESPSWREPSRKTPRSPPIAPSWPSARRGWAPCWSRSGGSTRASRCWDGPRRRSSG
jgi:serine/threonine protein kinase